MPQIHDGGASLQPSWQLATDKVGPLVKLHVAFSRTLFRPGPAWAVVAGALAGGVRLLLPEAVLRVVAAVVLADVAWGMLRRYVAAPTPAPLSQHTAPFLPYAQPGSPLARVLRTLAVGHTLGDGDLRAAGQEFFAGLVLVGAGSALLGLAAFALSVSALGITWLAWALARRGRQPLLCLAVLDVGLPWALGMSLAGAGSTAALSAIAGSGVLPAVAFSVLQWGIYRSCQTASPPSPVLWWGQVGVIVGLVLLRQSGATAVVAALLTPPAWCLQRAGKVTTLHWLGSASGWWWAAMLVAAVAVRA